MTSDSCGSTNVGAMPVDVSIVIPVFNRVELTRACLESLDRCTTRRLRWDVIIVDNGSSDATPTYLEHAMKTYPWLRVIRHDSNLGFSRACNLGVEASAGHAVLLLNNDTEATPGWLEPLYRTLYGDDEVAAVGSRLLFPDGTIQHAGVFLMDGSLFGEPLIAQHIYFRLPGDYPAAQERRAYQALTGACLLVRRERYREVGGLDESYWNGYEDIDFCLKLTSRGWRCIYEPESIVIHFESQSGPERFRRVRENVVRLNERWSKVVSADFRMDEKKQLHPVPLGGIYRYRLADGVTFNDILRRRESTKTPDHAFHEAIPFTASRLPRDTPHEAFNVVLIEPQGYEHSRAFFEIGELLHESLTSLGFPASFQKNRVEQGATNIILGYQLLPEPRDLIPFRHIIFQLEQLSDREGWFRPTMLRTLARADEVWDYADENVDFLRQRGLENVRTVELGFHERLRRIVRREPDIDVLFYGSLNERRRAILDQIAKFASVKCLVGVYGRERDESLARAKVILNIHFYQAQIMEQARISYLLNNRLFVLSEASPTNPYGNSLVTCPYEDLVKTCQWYLENPQERFARARDGYQAFSRRPMSAILEEIVGRPQLAITA